ncbi:kinase-like protein [Gonapodya prolifera JEL478]|uniref:Kinase-like protein n=1 Tax=Gonapodya prolifera (strain JEL478) TaxID=1344416 RepID=A0A139ASZ4_GONPJ|nr:kinase-like protein [Gonapodya prolifera JEL478]|eukprot:KXS19615.1 kinase-like protein [Gonapodya prolifera JEL478]
MPTTVTGATGQWSIESADIGSGAFSVVRAAVNLDTGVKAVAKICTLSSSDPENRSLYAKREIACLSHLASGNHRHPNIVKLLDAAIVGDVIYTFLERADGIELFEFLKTYADGLPVHHVRRITAQLLSALSFMHAHHVLHRDIKLDNVIVDPETMHVTIIDFNLSTFFREDVSLTESVGCINYSSPQILQAAHGTPYLPKKGWSDLWALGVTVYGMLCGYFPFRSERPHRLAREHLLLRTQPLPWYTASVDPAARSFVERILTPSSRGEISAESLLAHPFVQGAAAGTGAAEGLMCSREAAYPWDAAIRHDDGLFATDLDMQEAAVSVLIADILRSAKAGTDAHEPAHVHVRVHVSSGLEVHELEKEKEDLRELAIGRSNSDCTLRGDVGDANGVLDVNAIAIQDVKLVGAAHVVNERNWKLNIDPALAGHGNGNDVLNLYFKNLTT